MTSRKLLTCSVRVNHGPRGDGRPFDFPLDTLGASAKQGRPRLSERAKLAFLADRISTAVALIVATFREIFDESAYTRFLSRHGLAVSRETYAAFLQEQEFVKSRRHRCC